MSITTNNQWRNFLYRDEVPAKILADDFAWCDSDDGFLKYRGRYYHLEEFMRSEHFVGWHGYNSDSFFSGVLIRLSRDGEQYQIATYIN